MQSKYFLLSAPAECWSGHPPPAQHWLPPAQHVPLHATVVQHVPPMQSWLPVQAWVQLPQCAALVFVSMQAPEQTVWPAPQQTPWLQVCPAEQADPAPEQAPQWFGSVWRLTQDVDEQAVNGALHTQLPVVQVSLASHCVPQVPQFFSSVCVLTQAVGVDWGH
jgi:hypothetical protein